MKPMKIILILITLISISNYATAGHYNNDSIYADVVEVQAIYERVRVPQNHKVCKNRRNNYNDRYRTNHRENGGGAILGGIIGGLIGNRFGKGHGRDAATAAGVIAGAAIGSKARPKGYYSQNGRQCHTQRDYYEEQRIAGYEVSYEYMGRIYHTRLQNHPGDRVRINVNVQVAEY